MRGTLIYGREDALYYYVILAGGIQISNSLITKMWERQSVNMRPVSDANGRTYAHPLLHNLLLHF
jgi:hypothetical protein